MYNIVTILITWYCVIEICKRVELKCSHQERRKERERRKKEGRREGGKEGGRKEREKEKGKYVK